MTINIEAKIPPITLRFVADLSEYESQKPYEIWLENVPAGIEKTNVQWVEHHNIPLQNMRLYPTSLDTTGFTYINHLSENLPEFISYRKESGEEFSVFQEGKSMELYLEETSKMVKELLSANVTFVQDWRVSFGSSLVKIYEVLNDEVAPQRHGRGSEVLGVSQKRGTRPDEGAETCSECPLGYDTIHSSKTFEPGLTPRFFLYRRF